MGCTIVAHFAKLCSKYCIKPTALYANLISGNACHYIIPTVIDVIETHGYGIRFRLTLVSIHVAKVQLVRRFDHEGLRQL